MSAEEQWLERCGQGTDYYRLQLKRVENVRRLQRLVTSTGKYSARYN